MATRLSTIVSTAAQSDQTRSAHAALARLSVVVPVGPGDAVAPPLRAQLAALPVQAQAQVRVVLADDDAGARLPRATTAETGMAWREIHAPRGRATQQNAGARDSTNEWLWFLHADCELAPDTLPALARFIERAIDRDDHGIGYFDLKFLDDGPALMRLNAAGAWLRSRWLGLPFGDQGFVMPRVVFERLRGFDTALDCGEDHDLIWRACRAGVPVRPIGATLCTSARKYAERGWSCTTARHLRETWRQARRFARAEPPR